MMMRHFKRLDLQKLLPVSNLHILMVRDRISKKKDVSPGWWAGPVLGGVAERGGDGEVKAGLGGGAVLSSAWRARDRRGAGRWVDG